MSPRIGIVNYGMGNLRSVEKAIEHVGAIPEISGESSRLAEADGLVLPGVGAFPRAMERVRELGLAELIADRVAAGIPGARRLPRHAAAVRVVDRERRLRRARPARGRGDGRSRPRG